MVGAALEKVSEYLSGIGMGDALVERTRAVLGHMIDFLPEEPQYFFVSEYRDAEGSRSYESLWLLSENFMSEAQQFVVKDQFDVTRVDRGISRVFASNGDFDFGEASENSRLSVEIIVATLGSGITGSFKASGGNCQDLSEILKNYLMPLLKRDLLT